MNYYCPLEIKALSRPLGYFPVAHSATDIMGKVSTKPGLR